MCLDFVKKKGVKYNINKKNTCIYKNSLSKYSKMLCLQNELIISVSQLLYNMVNNYINIFAHHVSRKTMHIRCSIHYTNSSAAHFTDKAFLTYWSEFRWAPPAEGALVSTFTDSSLCPTWHSINYALLLCAAYFPD